MAVFGAQVAPFYPTLHCFAPLFHTLGRHFAVFSPAPLPSPPPLQFFFPFFLWIQALGCPSHTLPDWKKPYGSACSHAFIFLPFFLVSFFFLCFLFPFPLLFGSCCLSWASLGRQGRPKIATRAAQEPPSSSPEPPRAADTVPGPPQARRKTPKGTPGPLCLQSRDAQTPIWIHNTCSHGRKDEPGNSSFFMKKQGPLLLRDLSPRLAKSLPRFHPPRDHPMTPHDPPRRRLGRFGAAVGALRAPSGVSWGSSGALG